jgi:hypothetical protein
MVQPLTFSNLFFRALAGWYYDHNQRDESLSSTGTIASTLSSTLRAANHIGSTAIQATRRSLIAHLPGEGGIGPYYLPLWLDDVCTHTSHFLVLFYVESTGTGDPGSPTTGTRRSLIGHLPGEEGAQSHIIILLVLLYYVIIFLSGWNMHLVSCMHDLKPLMLNVAVRLTGTGDPGASTSPTTGIRRSLNTPTGDATSIHESQPQPGMSHHQSVHGS